MSLRLTAAKIVGETANASRFKSEAAFARYIGVAPLPHSSGATDGHLRMTRSGNRQLNAAIQRIAVTQVRMDGPGRAYYRKRRQEGDSSPAALRNLKRRVTRVVFGASEGRRSRPSSRWRPPGFSVLAVRQVRQREARWCGQAGRSVSLPAPIVLGRKILGERSGDLDEATPRGGQQLRRAVDDTAGPQMPVERHLDNRLTV